MKGTSGPVVNTDTKLARDDVTDMLSDIKAIRDRQDNADNALIAMQRENEALWREIAVLRQKHQKQQQIVDKLIHFLVTLVSNRNSFIKRKAPLMIEGLIDDQLAGNKRPRTSGGPVIHDVTDDLLEDELEAGANSSPIITNATGGADADLLDENSSQGLDAASVSPLPFAAEEPLGLLDPLETLVAENGISEIAVDVSSPAVQAAAPSPSQKVSPMAQPAVTLPQQSPSNNGMQLMQSTANNGRNNGYPAGTNFTR